MLEGDGNTLGHTSQVKSMGGKEFKEKWSII